MKRSNLKKHMTKVVAATMLLNMGLIQTPVIAGPTTAPFNYAEAFQKSLYFYDANKCGPGVVGGKLSWRGDCHTEDANVPLVPLDDKTLIGTNLSADFIAKNKAVLDPDGDDHVDLSGGFHDAGDHVKFGLPQSYASSTLGWGYYEFRDAYANVGEQAHIEDILRWFNDYFMRCTFCDEAGNVVAFAYQVGEGTSDHTYWGAPELQKTPRPAYFATSETPASDQCAGAAASLAINYLNFKETDPEYAAKSLETAKALYEFAKANRGLGFSGGFYGSSYDEDEMSWAAVWLNIATGNQSYIDDITSVDANGTYTGYMSRIIQTKSSTWQNIWVHSWDTVWGGVFAKLAPITNDPEHWYFFRWNLEYWSDTPHENENDHTFMEPTPEGFKVVNTWGSARYNTAAQLCALVYNKSKNNENFVKWSKSQMDYILGDNPMKRSYEVGYSDISAVNPHHRASHGSLTNSMLEPEVAKHTLWGALVGGPDKEDIHKDIRTDFVYNEVAVDYNAAFVGALAGLYEIYGEGQQPLANFPPEEKDAMPYFATAKIEQENDERTQVTVKIHNDTSCPPSFEDGLTARYYFDISELVANGQDIDDLSVQVMYDQASICDGVKTKINGPFVWDKKNNIYYVELDWSEDNFHGNREIHFGLVPAQDKNYKVHWNFTNDWSHEGLTKEETLANNVPVYKHGEKVYGEEPRMVKLNLEGPEADSEINYTTGQTPITLGAHLEGNEIDTIDKVVFYANDEVIGEVTKAPYTITYLPQQTADEDLQDVTITAKAFTGEEVVASQTLSFKVRYHLPIFTFTSSLLGNVIDASKAPQSLTLTAVSTGARADIEKITIYADDEILAENAGDRCEAVYTTSDTKENAEVNFKAVITFANGETKTSDIIHYQIKLPVAFKVIDGLNFNMNNTSASHDNTINMRYTLKNEGGETLDFEKFKIRYYFTKEEQVSQSFFCDNVGIMFNKAPWYLSATDHVDYKVVTLDEPVEGADSYLEISFKGIDASFSDGTTLNLEARMANSNWSNYDQSNDYSHTNGAVLLYDNAVVEGTMPQ